MSESEVDRYFFGSRNSSVLQTSLSLYASWVGTSSLLALSGLAAQLGWLALLYLAAPAVGLAATGLWLTDRIRSTSGITLGDYSSDRRVRFAINALLLLIYAFFCAAQTIGFGMVAQLFGFPFHLAVLLFLPIMMAYVGLGGFRSVRITDAFQAGFLLIFVAVLWTKLDWAEVVKPRVGNLNPAFVTLILLTTFVMPISQENHQRIKAAKSSRAARNSCLIAAFLMLLTGATITAIGVTRGEPGVNPMIATIESSSGAAKLLLALGLIAAALSTADTALHIGSQALRELFPRGLVGRLMAKPIVPVAAIGSIGLLLAFSFSGIQQVILICINLYVGVLFSVVAACLLKVRPSMQLVALLGCSFAVLFGYLLKLAQPGIAGFGVGLLVILLGRRSTGDPGVPDSSDRSKI